MKQKLLACVFTREMIAGVLGSPNNTYLFTIRENYIRQRVYAPLNKVAFISCLRSPVVDGGQTLPESLQALAG
jgi:hypothetical protein